MSTLKDKLEVTTNACVILAVICVGLFIYRSYVIGSSTLSPSKGEQLPHIGHYAWNSSSHTLLLALRNGCHFCEESMPFYRTLAELKKEGRLNVNLIAVFPDSAETAQGVLRAQNVDVPAISGVTLADLKVGGTPTLILTNNTGKVEQYWVGKQDKSGESAILNAVTKKDSL